MHNRRLLMFCSKHFTKKKFLRLFSNWIIIECLTLFNLGLGVKKCISWVAFSLPLSFIFLFECLSQVIFSNVFFCQILHSYEIVPRLFCISCIFLHMMLVFEEMASLCDFTLFSDITSGHICYKYNRVFAKMDLFQKLSPLWFLFQILPSWIYYTSTHS